MVLRAVKERLEGVDLEDRRLFTRVAAVLRKNGVFYKKIIFFDRPAPGRDHFFVCDLAASNSNCSEVVFNS